MKTISSKRTTVLVKTTRKIFSKKVSVSITIPLKVRKVVVILNTISVLTVVTRKKSQRK